MIFGKDFQYFCVGREWGLPGAGFDDDVIRPVYVDIAGDVAHEFYINFFI